MLYWHLRIMTRNWSRTYSMNRMVHYLYGPYRLRFWKLELSVFRKTKTKKWPLSQPPGAFWSPRMTVFNWLKPHIVSARPKVKLGFMLAEQLCSRKCSYGPYWPFRLSLNHVFWYVSFNQVQDVLGEHSLFTSSWTLTDVTGFVFQRGGCFADKTLAIAG